MPPESPEPSDHEDSEDDMPIGDLIRRSPMTESSSSAHLETEEKGPRSRSPDLRAPPELHHWIISRPPLRHCRVDLLDGLYRLSPNTSTSERDGHTLKELLDTGLLHGEDFRHRWLSKMPQRSRPFVRGDVQAAQLVRLIWLYYEARMVHPEARQNGHFIHCMKELNRLTMGYIGSLSASELAPNVGNAALRKAAREREKAILSLKKDVEACLPEWNDAQFSEKTPTLEFQERYVPQVDRLAVSTPSGETAGKRKRPVAQAVAAPKETAAPAPVHVSTPVVARHMAEGAQPAVLVPLPNTEYDVAPLPDGVSAVMLWRDYMDEEGVVQRVPMEGRQGWRPLYGPLASDYQRATTTEEGVELVVTRIQCGWTRVRKL